MTDTKDGRTRRPHNTKEAQAEKPFNAGLDLEIDAIDLIHKIGSQRTVSRTATSAQPVGDPEFAVKPGDDIEVEASLESVDEGIYVTGSARADVHAECSRCLDPVEERLDVRFDELFTYPEKVPAELEEEDVPVLEGDVIDLGPLVHDAFAMAAPYQPLCREDCPGLCPQCGKRMEEDPDHEHVVYDPRFAALAGLLDTDEESEGGAK
ncbi:MULTISPECIES: YceD family protein [Dermabacter]|uniref:DUF177 domain-containing protein n=1 Tax=Dermabacter vaginalis TaxID=1630135 RepID=A0ABX6A3L5_9MICO|nr:MULTISPECIES: DUF177 domain-containing protein [Dermabacter]QEU11788.1 DUF177 domain-containing protein [Dermabacter vaginalis]RUP87343.1 DUF177 domain-containing protein [Dermabacter sp. HSID17554]